MLTLMRAINNPLFQSAVVLAAAVGLFLAIRPPIPRSLFLFYTVVVIVGLAVYVTTTSQRMAGFWAPIGALLVSTRLRVLRWVVLAAIPLLVGGLVARGMLAPAVAPVTLRVIHPAPPASIRFDGRTINLREAVNPLREKKRNDPEAFAGHVEKGREVYFRNCFHCHGDNLAGDGPFAGAFNPRPADFQDIGTIAQLQESYLFWRIAKGGPGLPPESAPGRSAMPRWEGTLDEEQIWSVILFLYEKTGHPPRTWE